MAEEERLPYGDLIDQALEGLARAPVAQEPCGGHAGGHATDRRDERAALRERERDPGLVPHQVDHPGEGVGHVRTFRLSVSSSGPIASRVRIFRAPSSAAARGIP